MYYKRISLFVILIAVNVLPAKAQFQGRIIFDSYQINADGSREHSDEFSMFVTEQRILLEGNRQYNVIGAIKTEGILVRLDFEDFVFLTGDKSALTITKSDITAMMNMFGSGGVSDDPHRNVNYQKTNEIKQIQGYRCEKFIFSDKDDPSDHVVAWMTKDLNINWGMLSEPWGNTRLDMLVDDFSFDLIFEDGYFPLQLEAYDSGNLKEVTEATHLSKTPVAKAMVQIPPGVTVLSFQDYLFNKMNQQ